MNDIYKKYNYIGKGILVVLGIFAAYGLWNWLMWIGVYKGYKPEQPIYFSHKIHSGENKIDCQLCHSSFNKSTTYSSCFKFFLTEQCRASWLLGSGAQSPCYSGNYQTNFTGLIIKKLQINIFHYSDSSLDLITYHENGLLIVAFELFGFITISTNVFKLI